MSELIPIFVTMFVPDYMQHVDQKYVDLITDSNNFHRINFIYIHELNSSNPLNFSKLTI